MESRMRSEMLQLVGPAKLWVLLTLFLLPGVQAGAHLPHNDHIHHDQKDSGTEHRSLAHVSRKLSDPTSNVWARFTEFDLSFNNGNATGGNDDLGSLMNFQPILPVKFQFGVEYSVVSLDDFGKRALIKLNVIPVIPGLVQNPIFGGG
jgi:hypothetical protein